MSQELIVKAQTDIVESSDKQDILEYYGVPKLIDTFVGKEKKSLLNSLECGSVIAEELRKMSGDDRFIVEIPSGLRKAMEKGEASFIDSVKAPGSFSPNIKIKGENGIKGQITIKEANPQAFSTTLSNLAMLAIVQSVLEKMDVIESKIEQIKEGQQNDRVGLIIGPFKGLADLYPTLETREELKHQANSAYLQMQTGLAQLHLQINSERKELAKAPKSGWQTFIQTFRYFGRDNVGYYKQIYHKYMYDFQLYDRLLLLSDVVLFLKGDTEAIARNHSVIEKYSEQYLGDDFKKSMDYLTHHKIGELESVRKLNAMLPLIQERFMENALAIECRRDDLIGLI